MDNFSDDSPRPSGLLSLLRTPLLLGGIFLLISAVALPFLELHSGDTRAVDRAAELSQTASGQLAAMREKCAVFAKKTAARLA